MSGPSSLRITYETAAKNWPACFIDADAALKSSLLLGILAAMGKQYDPHLALFWQAHNSVALNSTRQHPILINTWSAADAERLAQAVADANLSFDGFVGPQPSVSLLSEAYSRYAKKTAASITEQSIFSCAKVIFPSTETEGCCQAATLADLPLLTDWMLAFNTEALPHAPTQQRTEVASSLKKRLESRNYYVWKLNSGQCVAMAVYTGILETSVRIGAVYTPPPFRKRGYASHLVAQMTANALQTKAVATLYTDKANPTSNKIYQAIGYKHIDNSAHIRFS